MIIDFHNHFYPPEYIDAIEKGPSFYKVTYDEDDNPVVHSPGDYNVVVPGHRLIDVRAEVLDKANVDKQIITFTAPGTVVETPERSVELASLVNNILAGVCTSHADHFTALGTLPLNDPQASVTELDRVVNELNLKGVMVYSNVNGKGLNDAGYEDLWAKANELNAVVYIHPTYPVGVEAMEDYMLMPLVGFLFDTTLAAAKLVFEGIPERYPNIKWVLCHAGGVIPYLAERLDRGFEAFPESRKNIDRKPSEYLKQFYYDTVNFDTQALQLTVDFAGVDHVIAGSDYPHMIGSLEKMKSVISSLNLSAAEKEKISWQNTTNLLGL